MWSVSDDRLFFSYQTGDYARSVLIVGYLLVLPIVTFSPASSVPDEPVRKYLR